MQMNFHNFRGSILLIKGLRDLTIPIQFQSFNNELNSYTELDQVHQLNKNCLIQNTIQISNEFA